MFANPLEPPDPSLDDSLASALSAIRNFPRSTWLELIRHDQVERWLRGNRITAETYIERMPEFFVDSENALVLICGEVHLRQSDGEIVSLQEYQERFPALSKEIAIQFELDAVLGADLDACNENQVTEPPSFQLPSCEILKEIGRGASGIVYLARQTAVNRLVAVKVVPLPATDSKRESRQRQEVLILSRLRHPNVVQLYDAIERDGMLCSVMEYVDGPTLAEFIAGKPMVPASAARLTMSLAKAVQVVHEAGVLHRDLKPTNILLTLSGEPKITDFGLAKRRQIDSRLTTHNCVLGTPSYMPPEQAAGNAESAGPEGDVYSLGAILYELLTGRPPFLGVTVLDTLSQIRDRDPISPRSYQPATPRDVETICMKCLQKSPKQRYPSAAALANDLERFLDGRPIQARRIVFVERVWHWAKRHKSLAAISGVALLALALGTVATTYFAVRANALAAQSDERARDAESQRSQAEQNLIEANSQRLRAESSLRDARTAFDGYLRTLEEIESFDLPNIRTLRADLWRSARDYHLRFIDRYKDDPSRREDLAASYVQVGEISGMMGERNKSISAFVESESILEALLRQTSDFNRTQSSLAKVKLQLASARHRAGDLQGAEIDYRAGIDIAGKVVNHTPSFADVLAWGCTELGTLQLESGRVAAAAESHQRAIEIRHEYLDGGVQSPVLRERLSIAYVALGRSEEYAGKIAAAEKSYRTALAIRESLHREYPSFPSFEYLLADVHYRIGKMLYTSPRFLESKECLESAMKVAARLVEYNSTSTDYQRMLGSSHAVLGALHMRLGQLDQAESHVTRALNLREKIAADHAQVAWDQFELGGSYHDMAVLRRRRGFPDAIGWFEKAIDVKVRLVAANPTNAGFRADLAENYGRLARTHREAGRASRALESYLKAVALLQVVPRSSTAMLQWPNSFLSVYRELALLQSQLGRPEDAIATFDDAINRWQEALAGSDDDDYYRRALDLLNSSYAVHLAIEDRDWQQVSAILSKAEATASADPLVLMNCGDACALKQRWTDASDAYRRAVIASGSHWDTLFRHALLRLACGDDLEYRRACALLIDRCPPRADSKMVVELLLACLLGENSVEDWVPIVEIARQAADSDRRNPALAAGLGAALVQAGRPEEAAKVLSGALPLHAVAAMAAPRFKDQINLSHFMAHCYMAIALHDLGDDERSLQARDRARNVLLQIEKSVPQIDQPLPIWAFKYAAHVGQRNLRNLFDIHPAAAADTSN